MKELHERWTDSILPLATAPFDMVSAAGYGCNLFFLAFNVGIFSNGRDDSSRRMKSLPNLPVQNGCESVFFIEWEDYCSVDGSINVTFCSSMGHLPGIEERFEYIISQILGTLSFEG